MKQTAVEFVFQELDNYYQMKSTKSKKEILDQAKEMEKQQKGYSEEDMREAFFSGCQSERQIKPRIDCWKEWFEKFKNK